MSAPDGPSRGSVRLPIRTIPAAGSELPYRRKPGPRAVRSVVRNRREPVPRLAFALAAAAALSSSSVAACGAAQESTPPPREAVAETERFRLYADPDMNLHHLLYHWARAENGEALTTVAERGRVEELSPEEREIWDRAVAMYWRFAGTRSLLFDDELNALRDRIAARAGPDGLEDRDRRLYEALELARPVYAAHWAEEQRRVNETWIAALLEDLPAVEVEIGDRIAAAYVGDWPAAPVTVDVSPYTNRVGGYTTSDFHVTISSTDSANVMPQALEILFHESSHGESLDEPVHRMLRDAFGEIGAEPPEQLWHTVLFVTAGELTRMAYERLGRPGYAHYGDITGLYTRRAQLTAESTALREHWVAFLRGRIDRETALERLARALASP